MSTPELHRPPVYACAAGAVLHAHSADTLEPAVLLYTFLPVGGGDRLDALEARVDVHSDGPGAGTLTVRVLSEGQSLSWQLPIAPFVAALPGQPGDDGRMVLLGVVDREPTPGFWAQPVDCEQLAAELQLPVTDLVDALRGRLTPWLADDVDLLLHDDAHEHAADLSPAQTLASAVLAHYRQDLEAEQASTRLVRAFDFAPKDYSAELGSRLCEALATTITVVGPEAVAQVLAQTGPFEPEVQRVLTDLPRRLRPDDPKADDTDAAAEVLLTGVDAGVAEHGEAFRAAVSTIARLARTAFGPGVADEDLLRRLSMVSDGGMARLAAMWVDLATAAAGGSDTDTLLASDLATRIEAEGAPAGVWLRATAAALGTYALEVSGRSASRVADDVKALDTFLLHRPRPGESTPAETAALAVRHCLALARFVRTRAGLGSGAWRQVPTDAAARAVSAALGRGLPVELAVDLLDGLLEGDVDGPDVLEGLVCATSQLLVEVDPGPESDLVNEQVAALVQGLPTGARGTRWLLVACLREAPDHDPAAADLRAAVDKEPVVDADRQATKLGRRAMLEAGLSAVVALATYVSEGLRVPREDLLSVVLPTALAEHDLLQRGAD